MRRRIGGLVQRLLDSVLQVGQERRGFVVECLLIGRPAAAVHVRLGLVALHKRSVRAAVGPADVIGELDADLTGVLVRAGCGHSSPPRATEVAGPLVRAAGSCRRILRQALEQALLQPFHRRGADFRRRRAVEALHQLVDALDVVLKLNACHQLVALPRGRLPTLSPAETLATGAGRSFLPSLSGSSPSWARISFGVTTPPTTAESSSNAFSSARRRIASSFCGWNRNS